MQSSRALILIAIAYESNVVTVNFGFKPKAFMVMRLSVGWIPARYFWMDDPGAIVALVVDQN